MRKLIYIAVAGGLAAAPAQAQQWDGQQTEVWNAVVGAWDAYAEGSEWAKAMDPAAYGWNTEDPVPHSREQIAARAQVFGSEGKILYKQLDPVRIAVSGDTAVAYYFANIVETDHKGERQNTTERCADTLVKRGGGWRFLGWLCHEAGSGDD